jgi:hypothetical protein
MLGPLLATRSSTTKALYVFDIMCSAVSRYNAIVTLVTFRT